MKKLFTYLLSAMMIFAVGCEKFDDSAIWEKLNSHESRITALEQLCRQMNTNISSLQTIVDALQNNDYVTNITPITEDGEVIGYTITFSKSGAITIYHGKDGQNGANGKDGKDGYTPVIGIAKDTDGIYYWTLDGEWLLDNKGNKVKATGADGKDGADGTNGTDGKDGVTPKLKIENGIWYVSYDNGSTWTELDTPTGGDNNDDDMFKKITYDDEYVYITLTNGLTLLIPRYVSELSKQIWYTNGSTTEATKPFKTDGFGANIVSNKYNPANECWVITFDGIITSIGKEAFKNCEKITSITIHDGDVSSIESYAFSGCKGLTSITIPNSVSLIGAYAFSGCRSLTSITIPNNVTSIKDYTFIGCSSLTSVTIPESVTSIGSFAFDECTSLTNIKIPNSVTSIRYSAFSRCTSLKSFTFPNGITEIEEGIFYNCI